MRIPSLLAGALLGVALYANAATVDVWAVDSLTKVFPDDAAGTNRAQPQAWLLPRNGHATVQFAVRSAAALGDLNVQATAGGGVEIQVRHVGYVPVGSNPPGTPYDEVVRQAPGLFPDPLL